MKTTDIKRKHIIIAACIGISCILAGLLLWRYYRSGRQEEEKHVVLIGKKVAHSTHKNGMLDFLANNPKYRVWYVLPELRFKEEEKKDSNFVVVNDVMEKTQVTDAIERLCKKGLPREKISYVLVWPDAENTEKAYRLQKELDQQFKVKQGATQFTMEDVLKKYQAKSIHGQTEVHLVLKDGQKMAAKAVKYTVHSKKQGYSLAGSTTLYESYVSLGNEDKEKTLINAAMQFANSTGYKDGGLTVCFDKNGSKIAGVRPSSRLFPKLGYRNIFENHKPSLERGPQAWVFCSIKANEPDDQDTDTLQLDFSNIDATSLKAIHILKYNATSRGNIDVKTKTSEAPVSAQVVFHLKASKQESLTSDINTIKRASLFSPFRAVR